MLKACRALGILAAAICVARGAPDAARAEPSWRSVGSPSDPRESSGVVLLPDGRVLAAGGHADQTGGKWRLIPTAEIYDSASEAWTPTGSLVEARQGIGNLTVLANGKVLLAGEHDTRTGAELYDPAAGTWSATGRLAVGRGGHSATLLLDGRVLAAGGIDYADPANPIFDSAEIYDPASGKWSATGSMVARRFKHRAIRLASGKVLAVGGTATEPSDDRALASAELFDPATGRWAPTGSLAQAREMASIALLPDGRALIAGGSIGRFGAYKSLASAAIYDPKTGSWTAAPPMSRDRTQFTLTPLADGRILAVGGVSWPSTTALADAEIYDPATGAWSPAGRMKRARWNHRAVLLRDGRTLVVGGCTMFGQLASAELFTP